MNKDEANAHAESEREKQRTQMLETALARPGVREVMKVYQDWREKNQGLDAYRSATKKPEQITTTNYTIAQ